MPGAFLKLLAVASAVLSADQSSKLFASRLLAPGESMPVVENVLLFTLVHNTGAVFGIFRGMNTMLIVSSAAFIALFIYVYPGLERAHPGFWMPAGLIIGGAAGNMADRVRLGYVVDFLDIRVWPVFNLADAAITAGIALGLWFVCFRKKSPRSS